MRYPTRLVARFLRDRSGATAIEYALIASCVAGGIAAIVHTTGNTVLTETYELVAKAVAGEPTATAKD